MYEIFLNEKKEIVETGEILFANLQISGQTIVCIILMKRKQRSL